MGDDEERERERKEGSHGEGINLVRVQCICTRESKQGGKVSKAKSEGRQ